MIAAGFQTSGDVANHAVQERSKSAASFLVGPVQHPAALEALDKNLLHRVVDLRQ